MVAPGMPPAHEKWLDRFHGGERAVLADCYREHYATVDRAIGRILRGADKETAIHEVFFRLISRDDLRRNFQGGSFAAWIATMSRNLAIDVVRKARREETMTEAELERSLEEPFEDQIGPRLEAQQLVE